MARIKENGNEPVNARINIKYNDNAPKISFSYPDKRTQFKGSMFSTIFLFWILICAIGYYGYSIGTDIDVLDKSYNKTELQKYAECAAENSLETLENYSYMRNELCNPGKEIINYKFFIIFGIIVLIPFGIYHPFKKKWNKLYPSWQGFTTSKKIRDFKKSDIIEKDGKIFCELPVFNNIICDFKCKGDFSDYLNEVDIREYKFHHFRKKTIRINKKKKKVKKVNEWIWYARWYFEKKPIKGNMRVIYK